jgi:hypothetical protein
MSDNEILALRVVSGVFVTIGWTLLAIWIKRR